VKKNVIVHIFFFLLLIGVAIGFYHLGNRKSPVANTIITRDTIWTTKIDTVFEPVVQEKLVRVQQEKLMIDREGKMIDREGKIKKPDSVINSIISSDESRQPDSVSVAIPITQRVYKSLPNDSISYEIGVSGYKPNLDYIKYSLRTINTDVVTTVVQKPSRKLTVKIRPAAGFGYGLIKREWDLYLGASLVIDF
jgi:hypothetical protein